MTFLIANFKLKKILKLKIKNTQSYTVNKKNELSFYILYDFFFFKWHLQ